MSVKLVSVTGPLQGTEIPIESDRVSIGRDPSDQIHIEDRLVSRHHCEIQRDGVTFHIMMVYKAARLTLEAMGS